jgi:pimeloyl-ACP methyl ester carboxylesterase
VVDGKVAGTIFSHAESVADVIRARVGERPVLVGHSFGGLSVQAYLARLSPTGKRQLCIKHTIEYELIFHNLEQRTSTSVLWTRIPYLFQSEPSAKSGKAVECCSEALRVLRVSLKRALSKLAGLSMKRIWDKNQSQSRRFSAG